MARIKVSTTVDAPPKQVWAAIEDISSHTRWMNDADSIVFTGDQTSGRGTTFDCATRVGPIALVDRMEITRWEPPRAMGVLHTGVVSGVGVFKLKGRGRGSRRTRFTWSERLRFPWWLGGPFGALLAKPVMHLIWRRNLRQLTDLVESGALP
jgi:uncharacterized protein YndB with AHSA1/START domain